MRRRAFLTGLDAVDFAHVDRNRGTPITSGKAAVTA